MYTATFHTGSVYRYEKEGSKQGQTNNKAKQHSTPKTQGEGRKKEASKVKQTTEQSNTAHPIPKEKEGRKKHARSNKQQSKAIQHTQGSHFSKDMSIRAASRLARLLDLFGGSKITRLSSDVD